MKFGLANTYFIPMLRILLLLLVLSLISCEETQNLPEEQNVTFRELAENPVLGSWLSVFRELEGCIDPTMDIAQIYDQNVCEDRIVTDCRYQEIEFREDVVRLRNVDLLEGRLLDEYDEIDYMINEKVIRLCFGRQCDEYEYTMHNNRLKLEINRDKYGCKDTWLLLRR